MKMLREKNMRLQIIHLSDMHFEKKGDSFEIRIDK